MADFILDFLLFVSQENEFIAIAGNQQLPLQPVQAILNPVTQRYLVGVNPVNAECHQIVEGAFDRFHIADQEQRLEDVGVKGSQGVQFTRLVDSALDRWFQKTFDRRVETVEGNQHIQRLILDLFGRRLESVQQGTFPHRQMLAGCPLGAD